LNKKSEKKKDKIELMSNDTFRFKENDVIVYMSNDDDDDDDDNDRRTSIE
jgi:hypothetical protein